MGKTKWIWQSGAMRRAWVTLRGPRARSAPVWKTPVPEAPQEAGEVVGRAQCQGGTAPLGETNSVSRCP